ncbi:cellobiohydrolase I-II [Clavulina sp. PMI_390]|nr:cellobiohydrolase I-II [Clavulina sp. PMI_390]
MNVLPLYAALLPLLFGSVTAQSAGSYVAETHPSLTWSTCQAGEATCSTTAGTVTLDANWRWIHSTTSTTNCFTGNTWNAVLCYDPTTCAANCALDGANYASDYNIITSGSNIRLSYITSNYGHGSRVFLLQDSATYQVFKPLNQEIAFTVDLSNVPCAASASVRLLGMDSDGGVSRFPANSAGAKFGTGYCDATCTKSMKFVNGKANVIGWTPSNYDTTAGSGSSGSCCAEVDLLEGNSMSSVFTGLPCGGISAATTCTGSTCGNSTSAGYCDPQGCDFNSYRMGNTSFWGSGATHAIDTTLPLTILTQFITSNGTAAGDLTAIKRVYVQNGKVIPNSAINVAGIDPLNYLTDAVCTEEKTAFGDPNLFASQGGLKQLGNSLRQGMVLSLSIWEDASSGLLWLDSNYPATGSATTPGVARGACPTSSGSIPEQPTPSVVFSNIKFGPIGSTYGYVG